MNKENLYTSLTDAKLGLVSREKEMKQLMYALLTREHMLLKGPAGTGKSQFAMNAFEAIKGASVFSIHLTKQTTEEYVFGPINIEELKKGNIIHNTTGSLLESEFAFIDEFFDASDVLLRSLLGILNERVWLKGSQKIEARLHTAILTSNYQRENEVTEAIIDRILFKAEVKPIEKRGPRMAMYKQYLGNGKHVVKPILTIKELKEIADLVDDPKSVKFDNDVLDAYDLFLEEFRKELKDKYISDRTANKALKVMKAKAIIDGRDRTDFSDIHELLYLLCTINNQMEEELFDAVFKKIIGSKEGTMQVRKVLEEVKESLSKIPEDFTALSDDKLVKALRDLSGYVELLDSVTAPNDEVGAEVTSLMKHVKGILNDNTPILFGKSRKSDS